MKGLLIKDLMLMKQRTKILIFLVFWGIVMNFVMDDPSFSVGWVVMIAALTSISTISYDEYDNGMAYLMSLPVSRAGYAIKKYLFVILWSAAFWVVAVISAFACSLFSGKTLTPGEDLPGLLLFIAAGLVIVSFSIPPQLKWGSEKGRVVMLIAFGVVSFLFITAGESLRILSTHLEGMSMPLVILSAIPVSFAVTALSLLISIRIMKNREF